MTWPNYFPDGCPPEDALEAEGIVYRFVAHNPPDPSDFKTHWERYPGRAWEDKLCSACSVSVIRNIRDAPKMQKIIKAFAKLKLAKGTITPDLGHTQHTPGAVHSHHDWWIPTDTEPWMQFSHINIPRE